MLSDPSWLYSTIAQASAAIVAIIGGFITATFLKLSSEKESLRKEIAEKNREFQSYMHVHTDESVPRFNKLILDLDALKTKLNSFSYPPYLNWGFIILGYMSIFNIFLPVVFIARNTFFSWAYNLVMYSFFLSIVLVFSYVYIHIQTLGRR